MVRETEVGDELTFVWTPLPTAAPGLYLLTLRVGGLVDIDGGPALVQVSVAPDETSVLSCPSTTAHTAQVRCSIVPKVNNVTTAVLVTAFSPKVRVDSIFLSSVA